MEYCVGTREIAEITNNYFEQEVYSFLKAWVQDHEDQTILQFDQGLEEYLRDDALRDFFLHTHHPIQELLTNKPIANHLGRCLGAVYFDPISGDPFLAHTEQRIYNLARRMDSESMHVPFRSIHPNKQTESGNTADISTYPIDSEEIRYNSGNHFTSRPANNNVFDENSMRCVAKSKGNIHILFKRGFLEDRLQEVRRTVADMHQQGETELQFFVIYSRHSIKEGHFGTSLVIMNPVTPDFPIRVMVCDTLLKNLPHHPRWWNHFIEEYSNVFGHAIAEIIEDLSHPLQKVNIKGDNPYRHDWDCPYYAASMADALAELVTTNPDIAIKASTSEIHDAMKTIMQDYYHANGDIKERQYIQQINRSKRWQSGRIMINGLLKDAVNTFYKLPDSGQFSQ
ncbi:MAG: hypothetical protein V4687_08085 [Bacteroidota bacterium]